MLDETPDHRVFEWLGTDSQGIGYYLRAFNLVWDPEGPERILQRFAVVADRLESEPDYWAAIIRTRSWRHTLVGCVCVLIRRPPNRFEDLAYRFEHGSFVSPQICITMGIVYSALAKQWLNTLLNSRRDSLGSKEIAAAVSVLDRLSSPRPDADVLAKLAESSRGDDAVGYSVVDHQWNFWCNHSPLAIDGITSG